MTNPQRKLIPALVLIISLMLPVLSLARQYEVFRIIDGDTFVVKNGSTKLTIRMVGIDAPEKANKKPKSVNLSHWMPSSTCPS